MAWSDDSPFLYNNLQTISNQTIEVLLGGEALNYMDDQNFVKMKENSVTQMRPKLHIALKKKTRRSFCTAMLITIFYDYEWVYIPCDVQLSSNYFLCEKSPTLLTNLTTVIVSRGHSCITFHIFIGGSCWTINKSPGGQVNAASKNLDKLLNPFLTAWSLGTDTRNIIAVTDKQSQTKCFVTIGLAFQLIKSWKIHNCTRKQVKFHLRRKITPPITDNCDTPKHFKCGNQFCLLSLYICDGRADCPDQSDETNCTAHNVTNDVRFHCVSGK